ncbi:pyridoxal-phosphate dependent enzyme [Actinomadura madurae]
MADGIAVGRPGDLTYAMFTELVDAVVTVTEESISQALLLCLERAKQVVEPAGAAGVAALLEHAYAVEPPVVVLLSGGNIDPLLLSKVLRHGLAGAGRYLVVRCPAEGPSGCARDAAGRARRAGRQRPGRDARAGRRAPPRGGGRSPHAPGDARRRPLRRRDRTPSREGLHPDAELAAQRDGLPSE